MTIAPSVLLPYQQRWIADQSPVKIAEKSRRVGLTWAEAEDDTEIAARAKSAGGMDVWYIGYNKEMAQEFIRDVADWARTMNAIADAIDEEIIEDEDKDILTYVIKFASGFRVSALSSRPSNLRGKQGVVVIDEAAFHDDLPGLIKAALALLMWGGKVRIISTHDGETNSFNELVLDTRAAKRPYSLHRIEFKEAVAQGLYRRICLVSKQTWTQDAEDTWVKETYDFYGDDAAEELDVIPSSGTGAFLTRAMIESVMRADIPVVRLSLPSGFTELAAHLREAEVHDWCEEHLFPLLKQLDPSLRHYFGEDFARNGDLTVIAPGYETANLDLYTAFIVELRNVPFEQQRQILFYIVDRLPRFSGGALDARGNGQYLAEVAMQRYGIGHIAQVMLSTEWYRENMPRFKAAFEDKTFFTARDSEILSDLRMLRMEKGIAKIPEARVRGGDNKARHGDAAIALAMLEYAARAMESVPMEFQSTGVRRVAVDVESAGATQRDLNRGFGIVRNGSPA